MIRWPINKNDHLLNIEAHINLDSKWTQTTKSNQKDEPKVTPNPNESLSVSLPLLSFPSQQSPQIPSQKIIAIRRICAFSMCLVSYLGL